MSDGLHVQYGSGPFSAPDGWLNFDASPTLRIEQIPFIGKLMKKNDFRFNSNVKFGDIVKGLPLPNTSCSAIYASHVLEHLSLQDAIIALDNTYSLLGNGGIFRIIVPDLKVYATAYVQDGSANAAHDFMLGTNLGRTATPVGMKGRLVELLGHSVHKWMWDELSLAHQLRAAGFNSVRRCIFNDCQDTLFKLVEVEERFYQSVAFECIK